MPVRRPKRRSRFVRKRYLCPHIFARSQKTFGKDAQFGQINQRQRMADAKRNDTDRNAAVINSNTSKHFDLSEQGVIGGGVNPFRNAPARRAMSEPPQFSYRSVSTVRMQTPEGSPVINEPVNDLDENNFQNSSATVSGESYYTDEDEIPDGENFEDVFNFFQVSGPTNCRSFLKGSMTEQTYSVFQLSGPENASALDFINELEYVLTQIVRSALGDDAQPDDGIMVIIHCERNMDHPITVPLTRLKFFKVNHITAAMEAAKISGKIEFKISDGVQFTFKLLKNAPTQAFIP